MSAALTVLSVSLRYGWRGPLALDGLSCQVPNGAVCGLIGPNGAGKTTLFSVLCGFLPPDAGQVDLLGLGPFDPIRHKGRVGVLPQDAALPDRSTCRNFLHYMALLQGLSRREGEAAAEAALDEVDLRERGDHTIDSLSHGMRRRLSAASALLGHPALVLLDEPTAGLDPAQARALREQLVRRRGERTLVISSHNLDELERICDHLVFIRKGRCVREGSLTALTAQAHEARWTLGGGPPPLEALQAALPGFRFTWLPQGDGGVLTEQAPAGADSDASARVVGRLLADADLPVRELRRGRSLEESFLADGAPE